MGFVNLEVNGKPAVCRFGLLALRKYCDDFGLTLAEFHNHFVLKAPFSFTDMAYFAYVVNCNMQGQKVEISRDEFTSFAEEMTEQQGNEISEAVLETKLMGKSFSERASEAEDTKKKSL